MLRPVCEALADCKERVLVWDYRVICSFSYFRAVQDQQQLLEALTAVLQSCSMNPGQESAQQGRRSFDSAKVLLQLLLSAVALHNARTPNSTSQD